MKRTWQLDPYRQTAIKLCQTVFNTYLLPITIKVQPIQDDGSSILILIPESYLAIAIMTNAKGWNGYLHFAMKIKDIVEASI